MFIFEDGDSPAMPVWHHTLPPKFFQIQTGQSFTEGWGPQRSLAPRSLEVHNQLDFKQK